MKKWLISNKFKFRNFKRGFVLIELLVVIAVIGALSAGAITAMNPPGNFAKAHDAQRKNDLFQIRTALDTYYSDYNRYPAANEYPAKITENTTGQVYIAKLPKDPLSPKQDYCYEVANDNNSFRISTKLERDDDPQAIHPPDPLITCNGQSIYNYSLTSTNTSTIAFGFTPTPPPIIPTSTPIPPTPTPTPTPTLTPTPTPTPSCSDTWTRKAPFREGETVFAVGFSINGKGYIGMGSSEYSGSTPVYYNDLWEYDPSTDIWTKKADFPGVGRRIAVGFSIGSKGYVGMGRGGRYMSDLWEYDPSTNTWTRKADFPGVKRVFAVGFSIGNKGYVGTGTNVAGPTWAPYMHYPRDFWEYDPSANVWTRKAKFTKEGRTVVYATGFSIGNKGYVGTGYYPVGGPPTGDPGDSGDFWEYCQ